MSRRSVQLGREFDGQVEILSGLQAGEQIVLGREGERLQEGAVQ